MAIIYPKKNAYAEAGVGIPNPQDVLSKSKEMNHPLDIEGLIKQYGIKVCKEDMEHDISGYIEKREMGWVIGINKYHSPQRQRFTLAHEFAHYILHRHRLTKKHEDISLFRSNRFDLIEIEANDFAGELLIPEDKFRNFINEGKTRIKDLSNEFNVSISAIRYKAYRLGYLNRV